MRQILVTIALIFTVWAFLPGAAQAHELPRAEMAAGGMEGDCADCPSAETHDSHPSGIDCHHGAGCGPAVYALPFSLSFTADQMVTRSTRPDDTINPRSVFLSRDLPPPRS